MKRLAVLLLCIFTLFHATFGVAEGNMNQNLMDILGVTPSETNQPAPSDALQTLSPDEAGAAAPTGSPDAKLTIMLYLCGSNLESRIGCATADLLEMAASGYDPDLVNIVIMAGGANLWHNDIMRGASSGIYALRGQKLIPLLVDETAKNMGDPETLSGFLEYALERFPAPSYSLILWDHGGGSLRGICQDELYDGDGLSMDELVEAIRPNIVPEKKLAWIGFDACLMASAEIARLLSPYADYMIASEESEPGYGWNYSFLKGIESDETVEETGKRIVDAYFEFYKDAEGVDLTLSCTDLSEIGEIVSGVSRLSSKLMSKLDQGDYAQISRARKKACSFGRNEEDARQDFDLVDMGSLADANGMGDEIMPALKQGIVYSRSSNNNCTGLSLYHPFYNRSMYTYYEDYYSDMGLSSQYNDYISEFYTIQQQANLESSWGSLIANLGDTVRDVRTILSLQLSEEQFAQLGGAQLLAFESGSEEDCYHLVATQEASIGDDGVISGEYVHTNLFVTDESGAPVWELPLIYTVRDNGTLFIPVQLGRTGEEPMDARLVCTRNEETNEVNVDMVWLYDEISGVYSPRSTDPLESFDTISFQQRNCRIARDESGALLPFSQWEEVDTQRYECSIDSNWKLSFVRDYLDVENIAVSFELTDVFNERHQSDLIPVQAAPVSDKGMVITYDDNNLLFFDTQGVKLATSEDNTGMELSAQILNSSGSEVIVKIENVRMNDADTGVEMTIRGAEEGRGLLPFESSTFTLTLPLEGLVEREDIDMIEFDLHILDVNEEELGIVPVTIRTDIKK